MRQVSRVGAAVLTRSISARRSAGKDLITSTIPITGRIHPRYLRERRGQYEDEACRAEALCEGWCLVED